MPALASYCDLPIYRGPALWKPRSVEERRGQRTQRRYVRLATRRPQHRRHSPAAIGSALSVQLDEAIDVTNHAGFWPAGDTGIVGLRVLRGPISDAFGREAPTGLGARDDAVNFVIHSDMRELRCRDVRGGGSCARRRWPRLRRRDWRPNQRCHALGSSPINAVDVTPIGRYGRRPSRARLGLWRSRVQIVVVSLSEVS